jgi:sugar fermentation stimulation protein A
MQYQCPVMQFDAPLISGRLRRRYKRFFADVALDDVAIDDAAGPDVAEGNVVVAHCPNPGSMRTCAEEGGRVWISAATSKTRRLGYTWELAEAAGSMVVINTARANAVVAEALAAGVITELASFDRISREVAAGDSRLDFLLERRRGRGRDRCWLEVKSATMTAGGGVTAFPDSVTTRGARHLDELIALRRGGARAALLFCASRADTQVVRPADEIDPVYGAALRKAAAAGVELYAYRCAVTTSGITMIAPVPIDLDAPSRTITLCEPGRYAP